MTRILDGAAITIFGLDPLGLVLMAFGCLGWLYAGDMKRRAASAKVKRRSCEDRRFGGGCDARTSQALAEDYRDSARQKQDRPLISEDGQPASLRVGLPRSRP